MLKNQEFDKKSRFLQIFKILARNQDFVQKSIFSLIIKNVDKKRVICARPLKIIN